MKQIFRFYPLFLALGMLFAPGCASQTVPPAPAAERLAVAAPDDTQPGSWAVLPEAGAEPQPFDVFYVYPTVFVDPAHPVMDISVPKLRNKAELIAREHTGMFQGKFNVFAPHYRQCELSRAMPVLEKEPVDLTVLQPGFDDIRRAFRNFLANRNHGRPFILIGHSQGAMALLELMKTDLPEGSIARRNLIAAYLPGWPVRPADLAAYPQLRPAAGELDTGVVVSWNTEAPGTGYPVFSGGICINPLNWRTDGVPAGRAANLGAVFFDRTGAVEREIPGFCGAAVDAKRGTVVVDLDDPAPYELAAFGKGVLHLGDILFFYRNLAENAVRRAHAFQAAHALERSPAITSGSAPGR